MRFQMEESRKINRKRGAPGLFVFLFHSHVHCFGKIKIDFLEIFSVQEL